MADASMEAKTVPKASATMTNRPVGCAIDSCLSRSG